MIATVFIQPHERHEAIEAYRDKLTEALIDEIEEAPETAIIKLSFGVGAPGAAVTIIEEG